MGTCCLIDMTDHLISNKIDEVWTKVLVASVAAPNGDVTG